MEESAKRGDLIYERDIEPRVNPEDRGKYVTIDIETGAYEIDASDIEATHRLRARGPDAQIWLRRVGSPYARRFLSPRRRQTSSTGVVTSRPGR
jgi:hypothetical protein